MTTFSTRYFTCNHCKQGMFQYELRSYHVHSSVAYSDGYIDYDPPISFNPHVIICHKCKKPLWYEDIEFIEFDSFEDIKRSGAKKSCDVFDLPIGKESNFSYNIANYYSELLDKGFGSTTEKEVKLRLEIWHLINNIYRFGTMRWYIHLVHGRFRIALLMLKEYKERRKEKIQTGKLFYKNLKRLVEVYQPVNEEEKLMLAEMYRELRNFSSAKKVMKEINNLVSTKAYRKINFAIKLRKSRVTKLN